MLIYAIIHLLCAAVAVWIRIKNHGDIDLQTLLIAILIGPVVLGALAIYAVRVINPVIYRKERR